MQGQALPTSPVTHQPYQMSAPPAIGQPRMPPGPQPSSPQMAPLQSPTANMGGMIRPFSGPPPPGAGGFQQPGLGSGGPGFQQLGPEGAGQGFQQPSLTGGVPGFQQPGLGVAGPPGYPQQPGNCCCIVLL